MQEQLVSIVVPIYNVEKYLWRCLQSISDQDEHHIEVIMVNDGSTDRSKEIADGFAKRDDRFYLLDKENGGLSSARNFGLRSTKGEYVCFVDSDDFLFPNYVSALKRGMSSDDDIVIADYVLFNQNNQKAYLHGGRLPDMKFKTKEEKKQLLRFLYTSKYPVMSVWKNMYRKSFLDNNHLQFVSERLVYAEDMLFHTEAYSVARSVHTIPDIVFNHLVVHGSLSQSYRKRYFDMSKELYIRIKDLLEQRYDQAFVDEYKKSTPVVIGSSMCNLCKCRWNEAVDNMTRMLMDDFVQDAYRQAYVRMGYFRYWILFQTGKTKCGTLVALCAKTMQAMNPVYRIMQRKQQYNHDQRK